MREATVRSPFESSRVLVMILAGGEGKRLGPLTSDRAKPAVPFGGRYRIIDMVLSNFVNSGLSRIKVLTQYKSASLEEHIARAWHLSPMLDNFIETIPAQQRTGKNWFKGSADAAFQTMHVILDESPDHVCIFGGDHVYKMDVRQMLAQHLDTNADVTVAAVPVKLDEGKSFGTIETEGEKIKAFHEKVSAPPAMATKPDMTLASMGNYIFKTDALMAALEADAKDEESQHDFGHNIIPTMVKQGGAVYVYDFQQNRVPGEEEGYAYWRDIGTVEAYWAAQMDLVAIQPAFNLYNHRWPIRTGYNHDPPAKFVFRDEANARVGIATESLVSLGCIISGGRIHRSVLSNRCRVNSFSHIEESVLFENVVIGRHVKIKRAIIDKDVEIPSGTEIGYNLEEDRKRWFVNEGGIVVIPKRAKIDSPPE
jgi:glucose-1-phosphate adenylyltransferase